MSKEHLKPFKQGEQRTKDIGRKGGKAKSKRKTFSNRINAFGQAKDKTKYFDEKIRPLLDNPYLYAGIILEYVRELQKLANEAPDFKTKKEMGKLMNETYSTIYGKKELIDLRKVSLEITSDADVILDRIAKYKLKESENNVIDEREY
jgi:hypothetical protein